jgi:uncharacterized protein
MPFRVGVLSDTHGTLHPRVVSLFREAQVRTILHAGDVGELSVLNALQEVAPVTAVRGNVDRSGYVATLPVEVHQEIDGVRVYMTHIGGKPHVWLPRLPLPGPGVAICGHSHIALLESAGGVLFLNPGAAGTKPRFNRPLTAALLTLDNGSAQAEIVEL